MEARLHSSVRLVCVTIAMFVLVGAVLAVFSIANEHFPLHTHSQQAWIVVG